MGKLLCFSVLSSFICEMGLVLRSTLGRWVLSGRAQADPHTLHGQVETASLVWFQGLTEGTNHPDSPAEGVPGIPGMGDKIQEPTSLTVTLGLNEARVVRAGVVSG